MARPRIDIDKDNFEKLCGLQCTKIEIASFFNCSEDTIERFCKREYKENFAEVFAQKRAVGLISLRRDQFRMAQSNVTMSIWLGKQYLGQTDKQEVSVATRDDDSTRAMEAYFAEKKEEFNEK